MTKIFIDRSVVEQAVKAIDCGYEHDGDVFGVYHNDISDAYDTLLAALDAKPDEEVEINGLTKAETDASMSVRGLSKPVEQDDLVQRLWITVSSSAAIYVDSLIAEAAAHIEALTRAMANGRDVHMALIESSSKRVEELEKALDAAKWALEIASDNTGYQSESDREVNHEINSARKKIDEIRKASLGVAP